MKRYRLQITDRKTNGTIKLVDTDIVMGIYGTGDGAISLSYAAAPKDEIICAIASMASEAEYVKRQLLADVPEEEREEVKAYIENAYANAMEEMEEDSRSE